MQVANKEIKYPNLTGNKPSLNLMYASNFFFLYSVLKKNAYLVTTMLCVSLNPLNNFPISPKLCMNVTPLDATPHLLISSNQK
jgi:hypothetical protein